MRIALLCFLALPGCIAPLDVITRSLADAGAQADAGPEPLSAVTDVSGGDYHSCVVAGGRVACWGKNDRGQVGKAASATEPARWLDGATDWARVVAGEAVTCALKKDGTVFCWGNNDRGVFGDGTTVSSSLPKRVPLAKPAAWLSLKFSTACAVAADGTAQCWGNNLEGQAGLENTVGDADQPSPQQVLKSGWASISCGQGHTCGLQNDGSVWCWGRNSAGQLGHGPLGQIKTITRVDSANDWVQVVAGQSETCARKSNNSAFCWGQTSTVASTQSPAVVVGAFDWQSFDTNTFHRGGIREGSVWSSWGRNEEGEIGLGFRSLEQLEPISAGAGYTGLTIGRFHTCAIKGGHVYCTGSNRDAQCGVAIGVDPLITAPVEVMAGQP